MSNRILTKEQVAEMLQIEVRAVLSLRDLPYAKIGRHRRYRESDVYEFMESQIVSNAPQIGTSAMRKLRMLRRGA